MDAKELSNTLIKEFEDTIGRLHGPICEEGWELIVKAILYRFHIKWTIEGVPLDDQIAAYEETKRYFEEYKTQLGV